MIKKRDWFWQLGEQGKGPDHLFTAAFDPSDGQRLADVVHRNVPAGFTHCTHLFDEDERGNHTVFEKYVDDHTYSRFVKNQTLEEPENIWYYSAISVHDHQLIIEHRLAHDMYNDSDLVIAISRAADLTLREWKVAYSGYTYGEMASGTDAASLRAYLRA